MHTKSASYVTQMSLQCFKFQSGPVLSECCYTACCTIIIHGTEFNDDSRLALSSAPEMDLVVQCILFPNENLVDQLFAETD